MKKSTVKKKMAKKVAKSSKSPYQHREGFYDGEVKNRWQAAFEYRVTTLKKHILISCSEAMGQLRDDSGKCPFTDWDIKKNQWKLQRMFTQLEADSFKDPTKGEHYVMLYEILYGTKEVVTRLGVKVEVDLDPSEKIMIIREMLKMGGHYAPEKSETKYDLNITEKVIMELHKIEKGERLKSLNDSKNRIKDFTPGQN